MFLLLPARNKTGFLVNVKDTYRFTAQNELAVSSFDWNYVCLALQDLLWTPEGEGGGELVQRVKFDFPCSADQLVSAAAPGVSRRHCF
jgi:hypothetical protein